MIQYELLKDLPYAKAGSVYTKQLNGDYLNNDVYGHTEIKSDTLSPYVVENTPDWFKKIEINNCGMCGGEEVEIRGRFPKDPPRMVCPTCAQERLEQINSISSNHYGKVCKAK